MAKPIISAQLYTVRDYAKTEQDLANTLEKVKACGYDNVQVSGVGPYSVDFLKNKLDELGMSTFGTHSNYDRIINDTDTLIEEHKKLGMKYIGLGWRRCKSKEETLAFIEEITPATKKIKEAGLQFTYHNHHHEFARLEDGSTMMEVILENTDPALFGLLVDTHWLQTAGVSVEKFLKDNINRIQVIHLKDYMLDSKLERRYAVVGEGNMDFESIMALAEKLGIKYCAVEQDDCYGENPFDCLARSRDNLKKMGY